MKKKMLTYKDAWEQLKNEAEKTGNTRLLDSMAMIEDDIEDYKTELDMLDIERVRLDIEIKKKRARRYDLDYAIRQREYDRK